MKPFVNEDLSPGYHVTTRQFPPARAYRIE